MIHVQVRQAGWAQTLQANACVRGRCCAAPWQDVPQSTAGPTQGHSMPWQPAKRSRCTAGACCSGAHLAVPRRPAMQMPPSWLSTAPSSSACLMWSCPTTCHVRPAQPGPSTADTGVAGCASACAGRATGQPAAGTSGHLRQAGHLTARLRLPRCRPHAVRQGQCRTAGVAEPALRQAHRGEREGGGQAHGHVVVLKAQRRLGERLTRNRLGLCVRGRLLHCQQHSARPRGLPGVAARLLASLPRQPGTAGALLRRTASPFASRRAARRAGVPL